MSVRPRSPFPVANRCLHAAMAARNCWHSSLVSCGAAHSTNPFTLSLSFWPFPGLAPSSAITHSAMATTSFCSIRIGCVPVLANQMLLSFSTSTTPFNHHRSSSSGSRHDHTYLHDSVWCQRRRSHSPDRKSLFRYRP